MSALETAKGMLAEANRLVDEFNTSVANGEPMDLQNFNGTIDHACKAALALPEADLQEIKRELVTLLDRLNAARDDLEETKAAADATIVPEEAAE